MAAKITVPGYWFIWGSHGANRQAGVVLFDQTGTLANADGAIYLDNPNVQSLSMANLQKAIQRSKQTFLYEVPATGTHNNLQSIGARAVGQGTALYSPSQAGVQATDDLYILALIIGAGVGARSVAGGGAGGAAGAETAGGGAAGGAAGSVAAKTAGTITGDLTSSLTGLGTLAAVASLFADPNFWLRIAEVIAGIALLFLGVKSLGGTGQGQVLIKEASPRPSRPIRRAGRSNRVVGSAPSSDSSGRLELQRRRLDIEERKVNLREQRGKLVLEQPKPGEVNPV